MTGLNSGKVFTTTVAISSGQTSTEADLKGGTLVGIIVPASLSSTSITLANAITAGGTAYDVYDKDNTQYTITTTSSARQHYIEPAVAAGLRYVTLKTGSSETSKTFTLVYRAID